MLLLLSFLIIGFASAQNMADSQSIEFESNNYDSVGVVVDVPKGWSAFSAVNGDARLLKIIEESIDTKNLEFHGMSVIVRPLGGQSLQHLVDDLRKTFSRVGKVISEAEDTMGGRKVHAFSFISVGNAFVSFVVLTTDEGKGESCQYSFSCETKDFEKYFSAYGTRMISSLIFQ
jgi:hypothetical protein